MIGYALIILTIHQGGGTLIFFRSDKSSGMIFDQLVPSAGTDEGSLGRNALPGFGAWQIDFTLHREIKLSERMLCNFVPKPLTS